MVLVEVTDIDIRLGKQHDAWRGPVTLAIKRATGKAHVVVFPSWCVVADEWIDPMGPGPYNPRIPLSDDVADWIMDFSDTGAGEPFSFELPL